MNLPDAGRILELKSIRTFSLPTSKTHLESQEQVAVVSTNGIKVGNCTDLLYARFDSCIADRREYRKQVLRAHFEKKQITSPCRAKHVSADCYKFLETSSVNKSPDSPAHLWPLIYI